MLSNLAKKIVPEHKVVIYFQNFAEYDPPDNLLEFYKFIKQKRIALSLALAHFPPAPKQGSGSSAVTHQENKPDDDDDKGHGQEQFWGQVDSGQGLGICELPKRDESKSEQKQT